MKAIKYILLMFLVFGTLSVSAQRRHGRLKQAGVPERMKARKVIRRTAVVIHRAYKLTKENKVYTGNLARAVRHQRYAKALFVKGNYVRAIHQSRLARRLAFLAIQANKGTVAKDEELNDDDKVAGTAPSDDELSKEVPDDKVTDEDLLKTELLDIDLSDND